MFGVWYTLHYLNVFSEHIISFKKNIHLPTRPVCDGVAAFMFMRYVLLMHEKVLYLAM